MSLAAIRAALESGPSRRAKGDLDVWLLDTGPWWRFFNDFAGLNNTKVAILEAIWSLPHPVFVHFAEPFDSELQPFLKQERGAWVLDKSRTAESFFRTEPVSVIGNWQMYVAPAPVSTSFIDALRAEPEAVLAFMARFRIPLLVDCFYDDSVWLVAIDDAAA